MIILAGEYHHYDYFVYPSELKVPKSFFDQVRDTGTKIMSAIFGKRTPAASAKEVKEVDAKILTTEEMAKQCLNFYLEPYMKQLLDEKYSESFRVDGFVNKVASLYSQHVCLSIKRRHDPSPFRVEGIQKVKHACLRTVLH